MSAADLTPGVSLVMCCYDSADVVVPSIEALRTQELPDGRPCELVLVDNNCRDETVAVVRRTWDENVGPLRVVPESEPGLMHARRTGVATARHDVLIWVDDDNVLAPGWVRRACGVLDEHPEVGLVGGFNEAFTEDGALPEWFERHQAIYACGPQGTESGSVTRKRKLLFGAGLACRTRAMRDVFASGPLFLVGPLGRRLLRGDDSEVCMRAVLEGWELWYDPQLRLRHNILPRRLTWDYIREARTGGGAASLILRMYARLIDGRRPLRYPRAIQETGRRWRKYRARLRNERLPPGPGNDLEIEACFLRGRLQGLWHMFRRYRRIRRALVERYGERWIHRRRPR